MNKKNRLLILIICIAVFLVITPYLVMYSMGYRLDFENWEITATGGIYVKSYPSADEITIDSKITEKPGMFSSSTFVQDLLPKEHTVLVKKSGYFDYAKTVEVEEKIATKIENITLFKTDIAYDKLATDTMSFSISPDKKNVLIESTNTKSLDSYYFPISSPTDKKEYSLPLSYISVSNIKWSNDSNKALIETYSYSTKISTYYFIDFSKKTQLIATLSYPDTNSSQIFFNPQDSNQIFYIAKNNLYSIKNNKSSLIIKGLLTYKIIDGNILWLSTNGLLSKSDTAGKLIEELTTIKTALPTGKAYTIENISGKIFVTSNDILHVYNLETKSFDNFNAKINDYKLLQSPDGKNMVYYNSNDIYLYSFKQDLKETEENNVKLFSANWSGTITDCYWLNNDYIIFEVGNKIIISEIDYRGNINTVELPQKFEPTTSSVNPKVIFNSQDGKVYILNGEILYSSEKIVP